MPKTKFQEVVFTVIMVIVMVYAMICYNMAISMGGMQNKVFVAALSELPIMGAIGFVLDTFIAGPLAKNALLRLLTPKRTDRSS